MVSLRSGASTKATPKKIVFLEDGENPDSEFLSADDKVGIEEDEEDEEDEDDEDDSDSDSDDAPEEESTSSSKKALLKNQEEVNRLKQEEKRIQREKRKQYEEHNAQQQELKKMKTNPSLPEELPEFLPEDLLESYKEDEENQIIPQNTHIRLDEVDEKEIKRQEKLKKLADIKKMKTVAINKGPVNVQIQNFTDKKVVPKAEKKVINSREKWLKRKSLNKV